MSSSRPDLLSLDVKRRGMLSQKAPKASDNFVQLSIRWAIEPITQKEPQAVPSLGEGSGPGEDGGASIPPSSNTGGNSNP